MSIQYTATILHDPCLQATRWLQVHVPKDNAEITSPLDLETFLQTIKNEAQKRQVTALTLSVPVEWQIFQNLLMQNGWKKSLIELSLGNETKQATIETHIDSTIQISTKAPKLHSLMPLLMEQAKYHSEHYPEYYRSPNTIDIRTYEHTLNEDFLNPSTLFVCAYKAETLVGYLQAEIAEKNVHIFELIVSAECRSEGIGSQILTAFLHLPQVQGTTVVLETWFDQRSRSFYEGFGFTAEYQEFFSTV